MQPPLQAGDGAIGIICVPTRELALQIYSEAKKVARVYNLTVVCAYGGGSLWEQQKACEAGCELLVCTPVSLSASFPSLMWIISLEAISPASDFSNVNLYDVHAHNFYARIGYVIHLGCCHV